MRICNSDVCQLRFFTVLPPRCWADRVQMKPSLGNVLGTRKVGDGNERHCQRSVNGTSAKVLASMSKVSDVYRIAHDCACFPQHVGNMRYSALPGPSHHTPRRHHNWCTPSHCSSPAPTVRTPGMAKLGRSGRWLVEFEKHGFPCPSPSDKNPVVVEPLLIILAECLPACLISNGVVW